MCCIGWLTFSEKVNFDVFLKYSIGDWGIGGKELKLGNKPVKKEIKNKVLTVIVHKEEDMYMAECAEVGTFEEGEKIEKAILFGGLY